MGHIEKLRSTTWILGTGILYATTTCYVIFLTELNYGAGITSMVFAYLLPSVVTDLRKELRGTIGCISWWAIALCVTILFSKLNLMLLTSCFLISASVSALTFQIHNKAVRTGLNLRKNKGKIRVSNSAVVIAFYFAVVSLLFSIAWYIAGGAELLVVILTGQSFTGWYYIFYYWNWSIVIDGNDFAITRFFRKRSYASDDICIIRKMPFGYYLAFNKKKHVLFCFTMRMEHASELWMIIRTKLTRSKDRGRFA